MPRGPCLHDCSIRLMASEYRGAVKSGTLPVPGVTVSAVQGEKKFTTTTDQDGMFRFTDLADGLWNIDVEMIGFAKVTRPVDLQPGTPVSSWDLKLLTQEELLTSLRPKAPASDSAPSPTGPSAAIANSPDGPARPSDAPRAAVPARGISSRWLSRRWTTREAVSAEAALRLRVSRQADNRSRAAMHLHRRSRRRTHKPEIINPQAGEALPKFKRRGQTPAGFQRLDVNQSATADGLGDLGGLRNEDLADLNQSAANSLSVQGSMSAAAGLAPQGDWSFGIPGLMAGMPINFDPTMLGPGGPGFGGPGGGPGPGGPGGPGGGLAFGGGPVVQAD